MPDNTKGVAKLLHGLKQTNLQDLIKNTATCCQWISSSPQSPVQLPLSWLQANITPIFKNGNRFRLSNYHPILLTSICCKLLEHIIYSNIMDHLDQHAILSDIQHSFRSKHSTETQVILTTHNGNSLNNKPQVNMIIMDYSKAFNTVPHNRLLNKIKWYGINNKTHTWISHMPWTDFSHALNTEWWSVENIPPGPH